MEVIYPDSLIASWFTLNVNGETCGHLASLDSEVSSFDNSFFLDSDGWGDKPVTHGKLTGAVQDRTGEYLRRYDGMPLSEAYGKYYINTNLIPVDPASVSSDPARCRAAYVYVYTARDESAILSATGLIIDYPPWGDNSIQWSTGSWSQCVSLDLVNDRGDRWVYNYWISGNVGYVSSLDEALIAFRTCVNRVLAGRYAGQWGPNDRWLYYLAAKSSWLPERLPAVVSRFKFNEPGWIFGDDYQPSSYEFRHLKQSAFWDAAGQVKVINQNSAQSIVEAIQFLMTVRKKGLKAALDLPTRLSDLWLQYRYRYNTTKMDVKEAISFIKWSGVFDLSTNYVCYGSFTNENGVTCRCKLTVRNKFLSKIDTFWKNLYTYGLQPNMYLVWDFTPFSFIVDWFLPVGDLCEIVDKSNYLDTFECVSCEYSLLYRDKLETNSLQLEYKLYSRWQEHSFPALEFCYLYEDSESSDKTIIFRCLDSMSLLLGRRR